MKFSFNFLLQQRNFLQLQNTKLGLLEDDDFTI